VKKTKPKKTKTGLGPKIENTLIQRVEDVPKNVRQTGPPPAPLIAKPVDKKKPRKADASVASSETESQPPQPPPFIETECDESMAEDDFEYVLSPKNEDYFIDSYKT
jgi:hypothetical protein